MNFKKSVYTVNKKEANMKQTQKNKRVKEYVMNECKNHSLDYSMIQNSIREWHEKYDKNTFEEDKFILA